MGLPSVSLETAIPYVAAAYIGIWAVLFGYLVVLGGRLSGLRRQVDTLTAVVSKKNKPDSAKS